MANRAGTDSSSARSDGARMSSRPSLTATSDVPPAWIARSLSLEPGEELRTALLFVLLFIASMVFVMGRTARDALFLTQFPVTWIAYMWVAYGAASALVALVYGAVSARVGREPLAIGFSLCAAVSYLAVRVLVGASQPWAVAFFYVWAEVVANLFLIQAWAITNDLHDPRSARRLFGLIGAGRILGMLLSGFVTGGLVRAVGTPNLILVIAGLMVAFAALVRVIGRRHRLAPAPGAAQPHAAMPSGASHSPRYILLLSVMLLVAFLALTIGDYQFKAIAKLTYPDRDELAQYMAGFYTAMGAIAFVFQVFITPRILHRFGVLAGLFAMPAAFLTSTLALLMAPVLPAATILKLSDNGLQYTVHDATMQLLYFAFPTGARTRVRAVLDAMVKPLGYSLGGVVLVALSPTPLSDETTAALAERVAQLGVVTLGLGVLWLGIIPWVRRAYVDSLRTTLARREADMTHETDLPSDATARQLLLDALRGGQPAQVVFALQRLAMSDPDALRPEIAALLTHDSPTVRAQALTLTAELELPGASDLARAMLVDQHADVRAAALNALGVLLQEDAVDEIEDFATDAHPVLRDAAVAALIAHGGLQGVLAGGARLQDLLRSDNEASRCAAARVLGAVGQASLARTLRPLLTDRSTAVRRSAAIAAQRCASPSLTVPLLDALPDRTIIKPAVRALAAIGPDAIPHVERRLLNEATPRLARLNLPRVLHGIGTPASLEVLRKCFGDLDEGVRQKALASASRLREELRAPPLPAAGLKPFIGREIREHIQLRDGYLRIRPWLCRPLLDAQIRLELRGYIVRVMRLCEQAYPRQHVAAARHGIFSADPTTRANALEVLDNVLDSDHRFAILDIVDRFATDCRFHSTPRAPRAQPGEKAVQWFEARVQLPGHYRRSLLFEAIGVRGVTSLAHHAANFTRAANPFMRENALIALAACHPPGWHEALQYALDDPHPCLQRYARYVLDHDRDGLDPEDDMYTTIEKILFLQGVPLFSGVAGNDLMPLAMTSNVVRVAKGETVFSEGDPGGTLFVVFHGAVALSRKGRQVAVLGPGEVIGEMAVLDESPRLVTASVLEDSDLLCVSAEDFREALQDTAEFANGVIDVLAQRLRELMSEDEVLKTEKNGRKTVF